MSWKTTTPEFGSESEVEEKDDPFDEKVISVVTGFLVAMFFASVDIVLVIAIVHQILR